MAILSSNFF